MEISNIYPRNLTSLETEVLFSVLPEHKQGYAEYREKIKKYLVTGRGSQGEENFILGLPGTIADPGMASLPVFALGTLYYNDGIVDIVIHEEIDNEIEIVIDGISSINDSSRLEKNFNYSEWQSGMNSPYKNDEVKEILIKPTNFLLAFAPSEKKIWLHNIKSGVNLLIPLSNYYNSLMLLKNERKGSIALNPKLFFDNLEHYNNEELVSAFILYNKYMKRVQL